MAANQDMADWIRRLRTFDRMTPSVAKDLASALRTEVKNMPANQAGLGGSKWKPGVEGKPVLQHVPDALTVSVKGTAVVLQLSGYHVYHHFGTMHVPSRPVWPQGSLAGISLGNAIRLGILQATQSWLERGTPHRGGFAGLKLNA